MTFKSILLGSAAVMAVTGAQAADLSIAEPVDYVRVCEAFGTGYWYIPGTDTCIKIGGRARFDVNFFTSQSVSSTHSAAWEFVTNGMINVTASSMTEWGVLTGFVEVAGSWNNVAGTQAVAPSVSPDGNVALGDVYLQLGMITAGAVSSVYEYGGYLNNVIGTAIADPGRADQINIHWTMSGFGLAVGIEDPFDHVSTTTGNYSFPAVAGAISFSQALFDAQISGGYLNGTAGDFWGILGGITFNLDSVMSGAKLRLKAAYGGTTTAAVAGTVNPYIGGTAIGAVGQEAAFEGSVNLPVGGNLAVGLGASYWTNGVAADTWSAAADIVWTPHTGFALKGSIGTTSASVTTATIRGERTF